MDVHARPIRARSHWRALVALALSLAWWIQPAFAQGPVLLRETFSRELSIHVGGEQSPTTKDFASREISVFVGEEPPRPHAQAISRELSIVVTTTDVPARVSQLVVTSSPTGDSATLEWCGYNEAGQNDVVRYRVYASDGPFASVNGLVPTYIVPAGTCTFTASNLTPYKDHYFAVVAEDALGGFDSGVAYAAAHVVAPQAISREYSLFVGGEPTPPYSQAISREFSLLVTTPAVPDRVTQLVNTSSPTGDSATLNWGAYNEIAQSDVVRYDLYSGSGPFKSVAGMTPIASVPAGTQSWVLNNLVPNKDHYFAVVAVDGLGGFDSVVAYSASYVVAPQAISREYTLFNGQEPPDPPRDIAPVALANPGFEALDTGNNVYWGQMDDAARQTFGWSAGGNGASGPAVFNNGSGWGYQNVPEGEQGISLQGDAFIRQTIQIPGPGSYILGWQAASRGGQVNPYLAEILDGETVVVASPVYSTGNPAWNRVEWHFDLAAGGTFSLRLRGLNPAGGDNSVALDGFGLGRDLGEGHRTVSSAREIASREISILVPDSAVPDPVTGLGSGFDAASSVSAFSAIDLSWPNYNEEGQRDVARYRIYVATSFFTDVSSVQPYEVVNAGRLRHTVRGLFGGNIYYVAVVAEDALGNWNPTVRSVSAKASVGALGEARNLVVVSGVDSLRFTWAPPEQVDAFLAHYNLYIGPSPTPIPLPSSAASYQATGLLPAKGYPVRLTTVDTFGTESGGITLVAATLLDNPGGVVGQAFDGMVRLTWIHSEPNELVKSYRVYRSAAPFSSVAGMTPIVATREPRADIAGLANGATTHFAVTTVNLVDGEKPGVTPIPATPIPVAGNFADLLASQVTGPLSAFGGETISIRWAVTNIGPGVTSTKGGVGVASWVDRIVLSPDTVFGDADDVVLAEVPHAGGLASGAGYTGAADVYVPPTLFGN